MVSVRAFLLIVVIVFITSCASTSSNKSTNLDDVPNITNEEDNARYNAINIGYQNVGKTLSFYLNDNGDVEHICLTNQCRKKYMRWTRAIHVDKAYRYSPTLQSFSTNHLGLCGKGNGKHLVSKEIQNAILPSTFKQLNQLRNEIPQGNHNWTNIYNDQCFSDYLPATSTYQIAEAVACALTLGLCTLAENVDIHRIIKFNEVRFKNDILRSGVDKLATKLFSARDDLLRKSVELIKTINVEESGRSTVFEQKSNELVVYNAKYDGLMVIDSTSNTLIGSVYFDQSVSREQTLVQAYLKMFESNMLSTTIDVDRSFIERLIPKEIAAPTLPPIPHLVKDEFEKIANFEQRVEIAAREREASVRKLVDEYTLAVYKRNAYINALEAAYFDHLDMIEKQRLASQKAIVDRKPYVSQLLMKLLYSDVVVTNMVYDAENENLYVTLFSARNQFKQHATFEMTPSIAKAIKTENTYKLGLNVERASQSIAVTGANIYHNENLYTGGFTDIQFEPVNMYVEVQAVDPVFAAEQKQSFAQYIQKQAYLRDIQADESYNIYVRTKFNRRKPEWFEVQPLEAGVMHATGQSSVSREAAILNAKATLAGFIQADVKAITTSRQAVANNHLVDDFFEHTATSLSDVDLAQYDIQMSHDKEIDGWYYVMLQCQCSSL